MTRRGDRRGSLKALGAAAVLAVVPTTANAGKAGKKAKRRCRRQVAPCAARFKELCMAGNQNCLDNAEECCGFLRTCNAAAASECIIGRFII